MGFIIFHSICIGIQIALFIYGITHNNTILIFLSPLAILFATWCITNLVNNL